MKLDRVWLPALIALLIAASTIVMVSYRTDPTTHRHVPVFPVRYGLDIRGGLRAVLRVDLAHLPPGVKYDDSTQTLIRGILENRINSSGVAEATVQPKGTTDFTIEIPDVKNKDEVLNRLGTTAQMAFYYFHDVSCNKDRNRPVTATTTTDKITGDELYSFHDSRSNRTFRDGAQIRADFTQLLGQDVAARPGASAYTVTGELAKGMDPPVIYLTPDQQKTADALQQEMSDWQSFLTNQGDPILTGSDIEPKSRAQIGGQVGVEPIVIQDFTPAGSRKMEEFTSAHRDEIMGIVLDDRVLSAPNIESTISDEGEIHGGFGSMKEAQDLATLLNAGTLPVPLLIVQTESVEASLGRGAVQKSVHAGEIALVAVAVLMLLWYRMPGLIADIALCIYSLFTMAIYRGGLSALGLDAVTMTLPGIAGFILSIGMAVDANILIFERMKEEMRAGRNIRSAIEVGFRRAFPAIRDSNICTMITCILLYSMGTASVRGFALTLLIGVVVSLFSAITVTRTLLLAYVNLGLPVTDALFHPGQEARNFNIIGRRYWFYGLSLLIIVPGLIAYFGGGLKKSIEFTGGTQIEVRYSHAISQDRVYGALKAAGISDPLVQMAEGGTVAIVSTPSNAGMAPSAAQLKLETALGPQGSLGETFTLLSFDKVAGVISKELTANAVDAVVTASACIVLYLAFVFSIGGFLAGLRLGTSAIIALLHDVCVLIGVFSILGALRGWKIDSLFVTAMLTVIGFSVHDTVVIFDRVRENLRHRVRGEGFEQLVNRSITQTLSRSLRTSGTVLLTLLILLFFGGSTTTELNFALFVGILSGTYSSIFNAAAILVDWENWLGRRRAAAAAATGSGGGTGGVVVSASAASGGSVRPISSRPAPPSGGLGMDASNDVGISRVKGKKKKPAKRF